MKSIGINLDKNGNFIDKFNLTYFPYYGDLILYVKTGNTPFLEYTVTAKFIPPAPEHSENQHIQNFPQKRFISTNEEMLQWDQHIEEMTLSSVKPRESDLVTVTTSEYIYKVLTADVIGLQINYCLNPRKVIIF